MYVYCFFPCFSGANIVLYPRERKSETAVRLFVFSLTDRYDHNSKMVERFMALFLTLLCVFIVIN